MKNAIAIFEGTVFANVSTNALDTVKAAKNPLSTSLGRDVVRNGFYLLNAYANNQNSDTLKNIVTYVQFGRHICGVPMYATVADAAHAIDSLLLSFSASSNSLKTCGISAFSKFLKGAFDDHTYTAPKKPCEFKDLDASKYRGKDPARPAVNYGTMSDEQFTAMRAKLQAKLEAMDKARASALAIDAAFAE